MGKKIDTQVLIVGAGSTGLAIARELSKYKVDTTVVEKNIDVCLGEVKGSLGLIYSSIGLAAANSLVLKSAVTPDIPPSKLFHRDSLKTRLTLEGFNAFPAVSEELDIDFKISRRLVLGKDEDDFKALTILEEICKGMDVEPEYLDRGAIEALEPHVSKDITRGLTMYGDIGYIDPWEYGIALAENARSNGVRIMLLTEVLAIRPLSGGFVVDTTRGPIRTQFIVNAAGSYADKVAEMAGVRDFDLTYSKFVGLITDKRLGKLVTHITSMVSRPGMSRVIKRTRSGNLMLACSSFSWPASGPEDGSTRKEWVSQNIALAQTLIPKISEAEIISSFGSLRVFNTRDPENHLFEVSKGNPNFLNAVTRMPGLALAPAMAQYMVGLLTNQGLELTTNPDFNPRRKRIPKVIDLPDEERNNLISQDPLYGRIICRCEDVSEGEIVEAIRRGARTVAGVKYRTRAGMGRCQRDFCGVRIVEILARELDIPKTEVTVKGPGSDILYS